MKAVFDSPCHPGRKGEQTAQVQILYENNNLLPQHRSTPTPNHQVPDRQTTESNGSEGDLSQKEKKIGFYTLAERKAKIDKYRQKVKNWLTRKLNTHSSLTESSDKVPIENLTKREKKRTETSKAEEDTGVESHKATFS